MFLEHSFDQTAGSLLPLVSSLLQEELSLVSNEVLASRSNQLSGTNFFSAFLFFYIHAYISFSLLLLSLDFIVILMLAAHFLL